MIEASQSVSAVRARHDSGLGWHNLSHQYSDNTARLLALAAGTRVAPRGAHAFSSSIRDTDCDDVRHFGRGIRVWLERLERWSRRHQCDWRQRRRHWRRRHWWKPYGLPERRADRSVVVQ